MRARSSSARLPILPLLLLLLCLTFSGCQTQKDAVAAAQQMSLTAVTLQAYYRSLALLVGKTEEAQAAQSYINGVPFDDETRAQLEETRAQLTKRAAMADALQRLSALFADLVSSHAAADAAKAADALNTELVSVKAIKSDSKEAEALRLAVNAMVSGIKAHDEIKAARLISPLANALSSFFDSEADLYQSVADSYYLTAASNSNALILRNQVSTDFLYRSSLRPFGLLPQISDQDLRKTPTRDLQSRIADRLADHQQRDRSAASDLATSLHVMRDRVARVAAGKPLQATLPPLTLEGVRTWVEDVKSDLGVNE